MEYDAIVNDALKLRYYFSLCIK